MANKSIKHWELYYTSSEKGINSETDGFGIRTFTKGLPESLVQILKDNNIFYYNSGNRQLPSSYDITEDVNAVIGFPKTFIHLPIEYNGESYYVLSCTTFIGKDYGWYLEDRQDNARSGNTFTHVFIFENYNEFVFRLMLKDKTFKPDNIVNDSSNEELKALLTGEPKYIDSQEITSKELENIDIDKNKPDCYDIFLCAIQLNKPFVVKIQEGETSNYTAKLLELLPNFLKQEVKFKTNYNEFYFDANYHLLTINEFFSNDVNENANEYLLFDVSTGVKSEVKDSSFFDYLKNADYSDTKKIMTQFDEMLAKWQTGVDFDILFFINQLLFSDNIKDYDFDLILKNIDTIKNYPLKTVFKEKFNQFIIDRFLRAIKDSDVSSIALFFQLIKKLKIDTEYSTDVRNTFTDFLLSKANMKSLIDSGIDIQSIYAYSNNSLLTQDSSNSYYALGNNETYFESLVRLSIADKKSYSRDFIYNILKNNQCKPAFFEDLFNSNVKREFSELWEEQHFFSNVGKDKHSSLLTPAMKKYMNIEVKKGNLKRLIKKLEPIIKQQPYFTRYSQILMQETLQENANIQQASIILNHLEFLVSEKAMNWENIADTSGEVSIKFILQNIDIRTASNDKKNIYQALNQFDLALNDTSPNPKYKRFIDELREKCAFVLYILINHKEPKKIAELKWVKGDIELNEAIRFYCANIPFKRFNKKQLQNIIENLRENFEDEKIFQNGIITHFAHTYNDFISSADKEDIYKFNENYYNALISLLPKKGNKEKSDYILDTIDSSLDNLKQQHKSTYKKINKFLSNEHPDIYEKVHPETLSSKVMKRMKNIFSPNKPSQNDGTTNEKQDSENS